MRRIVNWLGYVSTRPRILVFRRESYYNKCRMRNAISWLVPALLLVAAQAAEPDKLAVSSKV